MSNRIAVFNDGKVQQLSSPDELYEAPVNSFVAEFIGENNTFSGEVTDISQGKCKVKLDSGIEIMANPIKVKSKGADKNVNETKSKTVKKSDGVDKKVFDENKVIEIIEVKDESCTNI